MKKIKKGLKILLILILLGVIGLAVLLGLLAWAEKHVPAPEGKYDAVICLGAQVKRDGSLSLQLEYRLEKALEIWQQHGGKIIVCGAQGENEPAPEGEVMRNWLIKRGVPEESVVSETNSFNTWENIENAQKLLTENAEKIVIITSDYHLPRALKIAQDLGMDADGAGSPILPEYWLKNHLREVCAWGKYYLQKIFPF